MRFLVDCVYAISRRCSRECVNTCASTHVCNAVSESSFSILVRMCMAPVMCWWSVYNAVSESSFRVCGRGNAWRESACRAHVSFRAPSLHRQLYVRCDPSWASSYDFCAAERDNAALTCVPLTQARITAITYFGPRVTCCPPGSSSSVSLNLTAVALTMHIPVLTRMVSLCIMRIHLRIYRR